MLCLSCRGFERSTEAPLMEKLCFIVAMYYSFRSFLRASMPFRGDLICEIPGLPAYILSKPTGVERPLWDLSFYSFKTGLILFWLASRISLSITTALLEGFLCNKLSLCCIVWLCSTLYWLSFLSMRLRLDFFILTIVFDIFLRREFLIEGTRYALTEGAAMRFSSDSYDRSPQSFICKEL